MKLSLDRQKLSDASATVQRAVSAKSTLPVLEGILLSAETGKLTLTGYDLEIGITTTIEANVEEPGEIVLNARLFCDIIRKMPDDRVYISVDEKMVSTLRSGESEISIIGMPAGEYPERPAVTDTSVVSLPQPMLKSMINQTIFAVAQNDAKPVHTGVMFEIEPKEIRLISIDGYRLARRCEPISYDQTMSFVVPGKTLQEISRLLREEALVYLSVAKRHIIFQVDDYFVISRLLEGDFIDYESAIPKTKITRALCDTRQFIASIERISLLITDRLKSPVRCIFEVGGIKSSCVTAIGKANDQVAADVDGERVEIGLNNRYLLDALKACDCDQIVVDLNGPLSPLKIMPREGNSFLFLVLPVRLKHED